MQKITQIVSELV